MEAAFELRPRSQDSSFEEFLCEAGVPEFVTCDCDCAII